MTWGIFKSDSISDSYTKLKTEGWDDMLKSVKDKNATQPNGGSGKKQGTRYGGGKQKDDEAQERKDKKNESFELFTDKELDVLINEVLSKDASAGKWIDDFTKSDAPQFSGKSPEKRKQMALAAYYAAQKKESTDYESFLVLDEEKQAEIVKMGAKEIKHANMKDKQDDAEIMEPHSEGEANFIDQHYVNVTDDPTATKQDGGAGKLGKATAPKGQGPAAYKGDSKLSDKDKASYKEGTSEEGSNTISEEKSSGKKSFSSFKAKVTG